tara:strand:+ start:426 stop:572 length:147 start_codon:yes stop_codon:yes gene_type:complete
MNEMPMYMVRELESLGVVNRQKPTPEPAPESQYTYRKPQFDENGEPDF